MNRITYQVNSERLFSVSQGILFTLGDKLCQTPPLLCFKFNVSGMLKTFFFIKKCLLVHSLWLCNIFLATSGILGALFPDVVNE